MTVVSAPLWWTLISAWRREMPGSSILRSASLPRPMTTPGGLDRVLHAVDLEQHVGAADRGLGHPLAGDRRHGGVGLAAYAEAARAELAGLGERDLQRSGHRVALLVDVFLDERRELVGERRAERVEPFEVGRRQLDGEDVGHEHALARQDVGRVVDLALQGSGDLDGLHSAAERPRERAGHGALEALFKSLQHPRHQPPPFRCRGSTLRSYRECPSSLLRSRGGREESHQNQPVRLANRSYGTTRGWRNGRRAGFRCQCPQGRGGSNPPSRTEVNTKTSPGSRRGSAVSCSGWRT